MPVETHRTIVITDASVLINLFHAGHLPLLGGLSPLRFVVPDEVVAEITQEGQRQVVAAAIAAGHIQRDSISTPEELTLFTELRLVLGAGESSCLAIAKLRNWMVACDEKRVFLREATKHLGEKRIINTPGIYVLSVRAGLITVADADKAKAILENHRFRMAFRSFSDLFSS